MTGGSITTAGAAALMVEIDRLDLILARIRDKFGPEAVNVTPDTELSSIGLDSLDAVEFVMETEAMFGVDIPDEELEHVTTPRSLANLIAKHAPPMLVQVSEREAAGPPVEDEVGPIELFSRETAQAVVRRGLAVERVVGDMLMLCDRSDGFSVFAVSRHISAIDFESMFTVYGRRFEAGFQAGRDNAWAQLRAMIGAADRKDPT